MSPRASTIAIDGPVAGGKTTVGRLLAQRLGYPFLDTGSMYRVLTWLALKEGVELEDEERLTALAQKVAKNMELKDDRDGSIALKGHDNTPGVRGADVERGVSLVSRVAGVREAMVQRQRELAREGPVVMAGRDIGTVVLPKADLKIFLQANPQERAQRRTREREALGQRADYNTILEELKRRDKLDTERAHSPLKPAGDAKIVDTDGSSLEEVVEAILAMVEGN